MKESNFRGANPLATEPIGKLIVKFAIPMVVSMVVNALYNLVDQIFIGWGVGYLGNGATNVVFPMVVVAMAFSFLVGDGAAAYFSLHLGKGEEEKARRCVGNQLVLMALVGITLMIVFQIFMEPVLRLFGATDQVLPYALDYGRIIVLGFPFFSMGIGLNSLMRVDGSPRMAMIALLTGAVINTVLDPVAIFVFDWGVAGAAAVTVLGQIATFAIGIWYLPRVKSVRPLDRECLRLKWKTVRGFCALGTSSFISQVAGVAVIFVVNNALVNCGAQSVYGPDIPLSAFGVVVKVNQIFASVLIGLAVGSQPIIGFNYGARNYRRVRRTYLTEVVIATVTACVGWSIFQLFPDYLMLLFGNSSEIYNEFGVMCFRTFLLAVPLVGFQIGTSIFFQAIGKPLIASILSLSRQVLFLIPSVLVLSSLLGLEGVLWGGPVADLLSACLSIAFVIWQMVLLHRMIHQNNET